MLCPRFDIFVDNGVLNGSLKADHVHTWLSVPPKFSIAFVIGFLKGKSAVRILRYVVKKEQRKVNIPGAEGTA